MLVVFLRKRGKLIDAHITRTFRMRLPVVGKFGGQVAAQLIDGQDGLDLTELAVTPDRPFAFNFVALAGCDDSPPGTFPVRGNVPFE